MSVEAVKRQILNAISALNIPLNRLVGEQRVAEACAAAKLLRNRVLREHARVEEDIEAMRQRQLYDDSESDDGNEKVSQFNGAGFSSDTGKLARQDFVFISEMMVMENVVIPLLLAHGMNFSSTLLPQLLKLITAMLMPVPLYSRDRPRQMDFIRRLMGRCGTDEFFTLLIQSVAPVAEKRSKGAIQKEDVVLLEVVLKMMTLFFAGPKETLSPIIGAFARNHGIELFLVIINQNYARCEAKRRKLSDMETPEEEEAELNLEKKSNDTAAPATIVLLDDQNEKESGMVVLDEEIVLETNEKEIHFGEEEEEKEEEAGGDKEEEEEEGSSEVENSDSDEYSSIDEAEFVTEQYNARIQDLLESDEQLWKWNIHIVTAMSSILRSANPVELAQLGFVSKFQLQSSQQAMGLFETGKHLRECKKESDRWRQLASSCNGAISSNGLLVRGTPSSRLQGESGAIGCTSTLLGLRSKDPIEKVRDIDQRKKGRFIKGMSDDPNTTWSLPLPTKIHLAQQCLSFICFGFEPLNMMIWNQLTKTISGLDSVVKERNELIAGYKSSGEDIELPTQIDKYVLDSVQTILDYINICSSLLRYTREVVRLNKEESNEVPSNEFHQQWKCISTVISIDHIRYGFELLRVFLGSLDFRRRFDVINVVSYLAELFMTLNHLIDGDIIKDTSVVVAGHALASAVLYNEGNITLIFETISRLSAKVLPPSKNGVLVALVYSVLCLMEKCSFRGNILFPKRERKKNDETVACEAEDMIDTEFLNKGSNISELDFSHELQNESDDKFVVDDDEEDEDGDGDNPSDNKENKIHAQSSSSSSSSLSPQPVSLKGVRLLEEPIISSGGEGEREMSLENASLMPSSHANASILSSEREVSMGNYFRRIATVKNIRLILTSLRHWRTNDTDVNSGLTYLIQALIRKGSGNVFFNAPFLLVMRDILTNGEYSHNALYNVCDQVVYDFFNPSFAKLLDEKRSSQHESSLHVLGGAQSFLGFEVSLRCARSLFSFNSTDYSIMEEKGLPHLTDSTVIPLLNETHDDENKVDRDRSSLARDSPVRKRRRKKSKILTDNEKEKEGGDKEEFPLYDSTEITIENDPGEVNTEELKV